MSTENNESSPDSQTPSQVPSRDPSDESQASPDTSVSSPTKSVPSTYLIPGSILVAGALIALGAYFGMASALPATADRAQDTALENSGSASAENVRPVDETDHVRGSADAKVTIIEYSDFQCPFCSRFHPTVERVLSENKDNVRWVYRHFPLTSIHSEAAPAAIASECVATLAGNDAFWTFADTMFERQSELSTDLYVSVATSLGIERPAFESCLTSGNAEDRVRDDLQNAVDAGGRGTPFSVVVMANGELFPFSGALPYEQVNAIVTQALAQ